MNMLRNREKSNIYITTLLLLFLFFVKCGRLEFMLNVIIFCFCCEMWLTRVYVECDYVFM